MWVSKTVCVLWGKRKELWRSLKADVVVWWDKLPPGVPESCIGVGGTGSLRLLLIQFPGWPKCPVSAAHVGHQEFLAPCVGCCRHLGDD